MTTKPRLRLRSKLSIIFNVVLGIGEFFKWIWRSASCVVRLIMAKLNLVDIIFTYILDFILRDYSNLDDFNIG